MAADLYNEILFENATFGDLTKKPGPLILATATDISTDLNIDSVTVMDFVMEVEDHFDIEIPLNVLSETRTVADLAKVVEARTKKG